MQKTKKERAKTYRYKNGDIFMVPLDDGTFGYGIIICKIVPLKKKLGIIPEHHPLSVLMSMPILIRTFDLISKNESVTLQKLGGVPYKKTKMIMDWNVHRGGYPVVFHKELMPEDIDFPVYYGVRGNHCWYYESSGQIEYVMQNKPEENVRAFFSWGFGIVEKQGKEFSNNLPTFDFTRNGPRTAAGLVKNDFIQNNPQSSDFNEVFEYFDLPFDISFDDFNSKYGGYTKAEFAEIIGEIKC